MGIIDEKLKLLPDKSGVYVMLNADGQIIYVGKAKNLKNRVRQYFHGGFKTEKVYAMVNNVADFYYIITPSEIDALSLENNLIKKHKPRYNILLKDDKTYPYVKVDLKTPFPTFTLTRKIKKDGCKYFGPYMAGVSVKSILEIVNTVFGIRPCDKKLDPNKQIKPCLNAHIGKCLAPCSKGVSQEEYDKRVKDALDFLKGNTDYAESKIKEKMLALAEAEEFELALKYKDYLQGLEKIKLKRVTAMSNFIDADVIFYLTNGIYSVVSILFVRGGIMLGGKNFALEDANLSDGDAISEFISGYYSKDVKLPPEIILQTELPDADLLKEYLYAEHGEKTQFSYPKAGARKQLLDMAQENAKEHLEIAVDRIKHKNDMTISACMRLKDILGLSHYPKRMECYDISNVSGVDKVGSMVVFTDGEPDRNAYRRFKIKTFEGADDYRAHQEMMARRLERLATDTEKFPKPDLIVIDGGKGQLNSVKEVFDKYNITEIDLIALAERNEEIYTLNSSSPIVLEKRDYALKVLQRLRDEAHRFAITYHRSLHSKRALSSVLDEIKGLGKVKKLALIEKFKDIGGIIGASSEELALTDGIGEKLAKTIIDYLTKEGLK